MVQILFANPVAFLRTSTLERVLTNVNATVFKKLRLKVFLLLLMEANVRFLTYMVATCSTEQWLWAQV